MKVIKPFFDKEDNNKPYSIGDSYTKKGEKRISFLVEQGFLEKKIKQPPKKSPKKAR